MIWGVGIDTCSVARIQHNQQRIANRILTALEQDQYESLLPDQQAQFVASRFAVKEAVAKALGLGMQAPMSWTRCEITHTDAGVPVVSLFGELKIWAQQRQLTLHVSLSHEQQHAVAIAVAEHDTSGPANSHDTPVRNTQNPWVLDSVQGVLS